MATTASTIILDALPRLTGSKPTGTTFYEAINLVTSMLAKRLLNRRSDLIGSSEMNLTVDSTAQAYNLPAGFVALDEKPFSVDPLDATRHEVIEPLDCPRAHYLGRTCQRPHRYELLNQQILFYPPMATDAPALTVTARYFAVPAMVAAPTDVIAFNGMFDQAYVQAVPRVVAKGLSVIQADGEFELFLNNEVDMVLNARSVPLPTNRTNRRNFI